MIIGGMLGAASFPAGKIGHLSSSIWGRGVVACWETRAPEPRFDSRWQLTTRSGRTPAPSIGWHGIAAIFGQFAR